MTTNEFDTADGKFTIKSYGNGWAYEVTCNTTGDSVWVQDHDAHQLQTQTNDFEDTCVLAYYLEGHFS